YMNSGFAGPMPSPVVDAIERRLREESEQGPTSPEVQAAGRQLAERAREAVAGLGNVSPAEIALTANTTEGSNFVLSALERPLGRPVLVAGAPGSWQVARDLRALDTDYHAMSGQTGLRGPQGAGSLFVRRVLEAGLAPGHVSMHAGTYDPATGYVELEAEGMS